MAEIIWTTLIITYAGVAAWAIRNYIRTKAAEKRKKRLFHEMATHQPRSEYTAPKLVEECARDFGDTEIIW